MDAPLSARLGAMLNLTHGFIYFAPEATEEYEALGLSGPQHYFASRAAPLGPVPVELVIATFFNFEPSYVAKGMARAWDAVSPAEVQQARMRAAGLVLRRCCPDLVDSDVAESSAIAKAIIDGLGFEGKPLAAVNRIVPEPEDAIERLWQRITVLREWRGDVHVAALVTAPVTAVEALILHGATGKVPRAALLKTRQWSAESWQDGVNSLVARGLMNDDESFTDAGRSFREEIETRTDEACQPMIDAVGTTATERFVELLKPIRRGLLDGGAFALMGR